MRWRSLSQRHWWPRRRIWKLLKLAHRYKRNQENENFFRFELDRLKTRLLDEEYFPGVVNSVEKLFVYLFRIQVWTSTTQHPLRRIWSLPVTAAEVRRSRAYVIRSPFWGRVARWWEQLEQQVILTQPLALATRQALRQRLGGVRDAASGLTLLPRQKTRPNVWYDRRSYLL